MAGNNLSILLSKYRTSIMGCATLLIYFFHCQANGLIPDYTKYLFRFGFIGVEMFFFLSGLGLCYAIEKNKNIKYFYYRRFKRIYPSFLIVITILIIIKQLPWWDIILQYSTLNYWLEPILNSHCYYWYISASIVLYLFFPILFNLFYRTNHHICILIFSLIIIILIHFQTSLYELFIPRILVFLLGIYTYFILKNINKYNIEKIYVYISIIAFILLNIISFIWKGANIDKTFCQMLILNFVAPGLCIMFGKILSKFNKINKIFNIIGKASLDIYLIHLLIILISKHYNYPLNFILLSFLTTISSYLCYKCSNGISKLL